MNEYSSSRDGMISQSFVAGLYELAQQPLPSNRIEQCRRFLIDYLGVTLAGARLLRNTSELLMSALGVEQGDSSAIGFDQGVSLQNAAFFNGLNSHAAELDDGVRFCSVHPGSPIFSALLPVAQRENIKAELLFRSVAIGYEAAIRLGLAIQPSHRNAGYHATGTCGTIGAAIAVSVAIGLNRTQMQHAFGTAVCSAAGLLKVIEGESDLKPMNAANAASSGMMSAMMARSNFRSPDEVLGSPRGMLAMMAKDTKQHYLTDFSNGLIAVDLVYMKPYAACRHAHAPIAAALDLRSKYAIEVDDITRIDISTYGLAVDGHDHTDVSNVGSAKMSTPFSVAVALIQGMAGVEQFSELSIKDQATIELARKVHVVQDSAIQKLVPALRPAVVEITLRDGSQLKRRVDLPKGEPEFPIDDIELIEKFRNLAQFSGKSELQVNKMLSSIKNFKTAGQLYLRG